VRFIIGTIPLAVQVRHAAPRAARPSENKPPEARATQRCGSLNRLFQLELFSPKGPWVAAQNFGATGTLGCPQKHGGAALDRILHRAAVPVRLAEPALAAL